MNSPGRFSRPHPFQARALDLITASTHPSRDQPPLQFSPPAEATRARPGPAELFQHCGHRVPSSAPSSHRRQAMARCWPSVRTWRTANRLARAGRCARPSRHVRLHAVNFGLVSPTPNDSWTHWVRTTGPCEGCDRESAGTRPLGRSPRQSLYCCRSRKLCQASNRSCHGW